MLLLFDWLRPIGLSLLCWPSRCMYIIMTTSKFPPDKTLCYFFKHYMLRSETDHLQVRKQKHHNVFTRYTFENCKMIVIVMYIICEVSQKLLTFLCIVFKTFALKHMKMISY